MRKRRNLLYGLGILITLAVATPVLATNANNTAVVEQQGTDGSTDTVTYKNQWVAEEIDGVTYWRWYDAEGNTDSLDVLGKDGWQLIEGKWYFLDKDGLRDTSKVGKVQIGSKTYYLAEDGSPKTGEIVCEDGTMYNFKSNGTVVACSGWKKIDDIWYYYDNAQKLTGWFKEAGKWYYLEPTDGAMQVGFFTDAEGDMYYATSSGAILMNGWHQIADKWYYLAKGGNLLTEWQMVKNKWYYMDPETGAMATGWLYESDVWYYLDSSGAMTTGWQLLNGKWYYFQTTKPTGVMVTGWNTISGKTYYMDPKSGAMLVNWQLFGDDYYYFNASGAMVSDQWVGDYYLLSDGTMARYQWIGDRWVNEKGLYVPGYDPDKGAVWVEIDGEKYYQRLDGNFLTSVWKKIDGAWYYFGEDGAAVTGWNEVKGKWYYHNEEGVMLTGWIDLGEDWYYLNPDGSMATNCWVGNYYVLADGKMATYQWIGGRWVNEKGLYVPGYDPDKGAVWVQVNGTWYLKRVDGNYVTNTWKKLDGYWYYLQEDGAAVTGWKYIGKYKYYFNNNCQLVQDLDSVIGHQSLYYVTVNRITCQVMVYAKDETGYNIPVKTFACSVGLPSTPTPTGTFNILDKQRWGTLMGPSYGQWCSLIYPEKGIWFHSVAGSSATYFNLSAANYNMLGQPASHGCIRLCVRDAKWIYDNCNRDAVIVEVGDKFDAPFDKPATIKIPASQNWDPTDVEAIAKLKEQGKL